MAQASMYLTHNPVTEKGRELLDRIERAGLAVDIAVMWSSGTPHDPRSVKLAEEIAEIDWLFCDDSFGFSFGGDGDNGEILLYALDILFKLQDVEAGLTPHAADGATAPRQQSLFDTAGDEPAKASDGTPRR